MPQDTQLRVKLAKELSKKAAAKSKLSHNGGAGGVFKVQRVEGEAKSSA